MTTESGKHTPGSDISAENDNPGQVKAGHINNNNRTQQLKDDVFNFIDANIRGIRYSIYGVGVVGVILIVRSTRATHVFRNVSDIPGIYVSRNIVLQGRVDNIGPDCCLHVTHHPVVPLPSFLKSRPVQESSLPIYIAGIEPNPVGRKWLIDKVKAQHIWFKLLERSRDPERLDCLVSIRKRFLFKVVINEELIRLGLCRLRDYPTPPVAPVYNHVINKLVAIEAKLDRKQSPTRVRSAARTVKDVLVYIVTFPKTLLTYLSKFRRK
ncbi:protein C3orf33-like [Haliotis cracherodii]|uniref:protein C3orf33-like n=1 Tax=Haliotis cracherodii TaxID=6455 RepID=UPI0039EBC77A